MALSNTPQGIQVQDSLPQTAPVQQTHVRIFYSEEVADQILDHFVEGKTLQAISKLPGMPSYSTLLKWTDTNEFFSKRMENARRTRALHFEDKILEIAESAEGFHKDYVPGARLGFDAYSKLAEVNDRSRYGKQTTVSGDPDRPFQFIIHSGFPTPNAHQTPPKLNADGTIMKEVAALISAEEGVLLANTAEDTSL